MPKVYIPNKSVHDYSPAEKYGSLVYVTRGLLSKFAVSNMARYWAEALKDSSPDDLILSSSLTTLVSIGCAMFAVKHGCINLLLFRNGKYMTRRLMLKDILAGDFAAED